MLAMMGHPQSIIPLERAWALIQSWQRPDGGWKPANGIEISHAATSLCVLLHCAANRYDDPFHKGLGWLLTTEGVEGGWLTRMVHLFGLSPVEYDPGLVGWPWLLDTSSWVEPTATALVALKRAAQSRSLTSKVHRELVARVNIGERMLIERRCRDGGWNYGNRRVLQVELPGFPETTALALIGLQGSSFSSVPDQTELARRYWRQSQSPLAKAWLSISLLNYGIVAPVDASGTTAISHDLLLTSLQAIGRPDGKLCVFSVNQ